LAPAREHIELAIGTRLRKPNETFTVSLSGARGALLADPTGIGTILNDD
jgi:hypothetical protein